MSILSKVLFGLLSFIVIFFGIILILYLTGNNNINTSHVTSVQAVSFNSTTTLVSNSTSSTVLSTSVPTTTSYSTSIIPATTPASTSTSTTTSIITTTVNITWSEQLGVEFTQNIASLAYNVTAVVQSESGCGPVYLVEIYLPAK